MVQFMVFCSHYITPDQGKVSHISVVPFKNNHIYAFRKLETKLVTKLQNNG